ncbi:MAG: WD40 repeat domain-containing protein [Anaerolineae bacterium]|nr:WD40 repeat domain-containing protein [Anaerolineae bacterium]
MRFTRACMFVGLVGVLGACQSTLVPSIAPSEGTIQPSVSATPPPAAELQITPTEAASTATSWPTQPPTNTPYPTMSWTTSSHLEVIAHDSKVVARFGLGRFSDIELSSAGNRLAIAGSTGVSVLDPETFNEIWHGNTESSATDIEFSPDGALLASSMPAGHIAIWNTATGELERTFAMTNYQEAHIQVAISPDNRLVAAKGYLPQTLVWDIATGAEIYKLPGMTEFSMDLEFSPNGELLISNQGAAEYAWGLLVWRVSDGYEVLRLENYVSKVTFTPDSKKLLLGYGAAEIDLRPEIEHYEVADYHDTWWQWAGWAPDLESYVCFGLGCSEQPDLAVGKEVSAAIYDRKTGTAIKILEAAPQASYSFSSSGDFIVGASGKYYNQSHLYIWDAHTGKLLHDLPTDLGGDIIWFPRGNTMFALSFYDQALAAWDVSSGQILRMLRGSGEIEKVEWSKDGSTLMGWWYQFNSAQPSRYVALRWNAETQQVSELFDVPYPDAGILPSSSLRAGWSDRTVVISDSTSGESFDLLRHNAPILQVAWASDGSRVASAAKDQTVILWDIKNKSPQFTLRALTGHIRDVEWSPNNRLIAVAAGDEVSVWDTTTGERWIQFSQHVGIVNAVSWSPDGRMLALGMEDAAVILWNPSTGTVEDILRQHSGATLDVAWSPSGNLLASGSSDGSVIIWRIK